MANELHSSSNPLGITSIERPLVAYICAFFIASGFFVGWRAYSFMTPVIPQPPDSGPPISISFVIAFAVFFYIFNGFMLALVALSLPWHFISRAFARQNFPGYIYFPVTGAISIFVLACSTSPFGFKPAFIEDQSYFEAWSIAAQRQGVCFAVTGAVFGICYWAIGRKWSFGNHDGAK